MKEHSCYVEVCSAKNTMGQLGPAASLVAFNYGSGGSLGQAGGCIDPAANL